MNSHFVGRPYKHFHDPRPFDAIVIGSGIGGLGLAALLAKTAGRRVLVLERHYTAGGFTHVFHRPGYEWDVGVHYVGGVHQPGSDIRAVIDYLTENRLTWQPMPDVYDRVNIDGLRFDYIAGEPRLRDRLVRMFPRERSIIDGYFTAIRHTMRSIPLFFAEKALPPVIARPVGWGLRAPFLGAARHTTGETLDRMGASTRLKAVLTAQWGNYGLPPGSSSFGIHAIVAAHYFDGAAYPVGGASAIARSLLPTVAAAGGAVVVGAEVERILVRNGHVTGVRMRDGQEFRAATVISDAGIRMTFGRLLCDRSAAVDAALGRVEAIGRSAAHLCLYVGLSTARLPRPLDRSNLWIHPSPDFDRNWSAFGSDLEAPFPLLFVSFPSAKDPTFETRYPGHQTIEVVAPAPYDAFRKWSGTTWKRRGDDYAALKTSLEARLLAALRQHVPDVGDAIDTWELSTPLSTQHFANAPQGETYGLAHTPARFASRDLRPGTPVQGLFLTGQDVGTCGVAGALAGAMAAASAILRRNAWRGVNERRTATRGSNRRAA